jgi:hypothetical protein
MTELEDARDAADAVGRFARIVDDCAERLDRVLAKLEGPGGLTGLCAAEAALAARWPTGAARELVWLTRASPALSDTLHLQAFEDGGVLIHAASFRLPAPIGADSP